MIRVELNGFSAFENNKDIEGDSVVVEKLKGRGGYFIGIIYDTNILVIEENGTSFPEFDIIELGATDCYDDFRIVAEVNLNMEIDEVIKKLK